MNVSPEEPKHRRPSTCQANRSFALSFNMQQAPAGTGGLTSAGHAEFTLKEGAEPIRASNIERLNIDEIETKWVGSHDYLEGIGSKADLQHN